MGAKGISRREFVRDSAAAAAGIAAGMGGGVSAADRKKILNYNENMEYRPLGKTGLMVSAVCLGGHWKRIDKIIGKSVMRRRGWLNANLDDPRFIKNRADVVSRCIEVGINYIDACTGQEVLAYARALKGRRDKMYFGYSWYQHEMRFKPWQNSLENMYSLFGRIGTFWRVIPLFVCMWLLASLSYSEIINVRDFGAVHGNTKNDTAAIQNAIAACADKGGGTVYFPSGEYLAAGIRLRSNVTLLLETGSTLFASRNPQDYTGGSRHLIYAKDAENISIVGPGTLNGQADAPLGRAGKGPKRKPRFRIGMIFLENCRNVTIRDLNILYSDAWTIHLKRCDTVYINNVTIRNNYFRVNSDGIDPNSCRNVHISNCHIVAGDDCIVLKATDPCPCENVVVTNCTLETIATALKLGTESKGDFRNIQVSNCTIRNTPVGIGFYMKDGATMERVNFSNISIESTSAEKRSVFPIFMDIEKRLPDSKIGKIRDVSFRNIFIQSGSGILIQGMPESPIENLSLQNITLRIGEPDDYSRRSKAIGGRRTTHDERDTLYARQPSYLALAYINGLLLDGIKVIIGEKSFKKYPRSAVSANHVSNAVIRNVLRRPAGISAPPPVIMLNGCRDVLVTNCLGGEKNFVGIEGEKTKRVTILVPGVGKNSVKIGSGGLKGEVKIFGSGNNLSE